MSEHAVSLEIPHFTPTRGVVILVERTMVGRATRAARALGALWLAALVCVFIPLLHFVLVPSLLLAGPIVAFLRLREDVSLAAVRGACPRCQVDRTFEGSGRFRDGRHLHCDGCGRSITLRLQGDVPPSASP
jgi:hypothetical protein